MKIYILLFITSLLFLSCSSENNSKKLDKLQRYDAVWKQADFSKLSSLGCIIDENQDERKPEVSCPQSADKATTLNTLKDYQAQLRDLKNDSTPLQDQIVLTLLDARLSVVSASYISVPETLTQNYNKIPSQLYPDNDADIEFVTAFFNILELHQSEDPFMEGAGPSVPGYSIDEMAFSFIINDSGDKVDLAIFNWEKEVKPNFEEDILLSLNYGSPVYLLKNVDKLSIATQESGKLGNFSYIVGSNYFKAQIQKDFGPEYEVPEELLDYKPHSNYIGRDHPLRKALDSRSLILIAPNEKYLFGLVPGYDNLPPTQKETVRSTMLNENSGGYLQTVLGMIIHESFHVKEGLDGSNRLIPEDRESLKQALESSVELKTLMSLYTKIIFEIATNLKNTNVNQSDKLLLVDLKVIIEALKSNFPNAWDFIRSYEFTEGFAEYTSAYSLIKTGIVSIEDKVKYEKIDGNNFTYRTGAFAGLFLNFKIKSMPFSEKEDTKFGPWEIILNILDVQSSEISISDLNTKYSDVEFNTLEEMEKVSEYLTSTIIEN